MNHRIATKVEIVDPNNLRDLIMQVFEDIAEEAITRIVVGWRTMRLFCPELRLTGLRMSTLERSKRSVGALLLVEYPGRLAVLLGPKFDQAWLDENAEHSVRAKEIISQAIQVARTWGVDLVQALVHSHSRDGHSDDNAQFEVRKTAKSPTLWDQSQQLSRFLESAGMTRVGLLEQMRVTFDKVSESYPLTSSLSSPTMLGARLNADRPVAQVSELNSPDEPDRKFHDANHWIPFRLNEDPINGLHLDEHKKDAIPKLDGSQCTFESNRDEDSNSQRKFIPANFTQKLWIDWIDQTYIDSRDCPALNGLRSTSDTLYGYYITALTNAAVQTSESIESQSKLIDQQFEKELEWWGLFDAARQRIIAGYFLSPFDSDSMELSYMGVIPELRGRGLGRMCIRHAIERARLRDLNSIVLAVDSENLPSINLYQTYGFQIDGAIEAWIRSID